VGTIAELFALAWKHHQAGDLFQAELLYRHVVQADPRHADAWCFLGAACQAQGKLAEAEANFRRAVQLTPCHPSAQNCLGIMLAQQGKLDEAATCFIQLIDCQTNDADAHNNLGLVRAQQGRHEEAVASFQRALALQPNFPAARENLAMALQRYQSGGEPAPGRASPGDRAVGEEAKALSRQGVELARAGRFDAAKTCFEQGLRLQPDNVDLHNNLGSLLANQRLFDEAIAQYQEAVRIYPGFSEGHYNLGIVLAKQGRRQEAQAAYREALRLCPDHLDAQNNLGNLHKEMGEFPQALACYEKALRCAPEHPGTRFNRALALLVQGDFDRGLPEYEWRWRTDEFPPCAFRQPRWDGSTLTPPIQPPANASKEAGRTILLHAEQGLGDTIQFIRYAPLVRQRVGRVIVQCQAPLVRLLSTVRGIDKVVGRGSPLTGFDLQAPLASLPGLFHTTPATIPAAVPYVHAETQLADCWRRHLATMPGVKVGIAWQGSPTFRDDRLRSIPLAKFEPLTKVAGVQLINLQKGPGTEQLRCVAGRFPVVDFGDRMDEAHGAFMDTAAIMKSLDLVITSDSAVAHLAGALAVPVWVALPLAPDWRWLLHRTDSPWYPTMRLFRQRQLGDWDEVFRRIVEELKAQLQVTRSSLSKPTPDKAQPATQN